MTPVTRITRKDVVEALDRVGGDDRFKNEANLIRAYLQSLEFRLELNQDEDIYRESTYQSMPASYQK